MMSLYESFRLSGPGCHDQSCVVVIEIGGDISTYLRPASSQGSRCSARNFCPSFHLVSALLCCLDECGVYCSRNWRHVRIVKVTGRENLVRTQHLSSTYIIVHTPSYSIPHSVMSMLIIVLLWLFKPILHRGRFSTCLTFNFRHLLFVRL